jgi:hypothetical protein
MAQVTWSQDVFSKGELSPLMYSRVTVEAYFRGLKTARNVLTYPQGAAGKRFGTIFQNDITTGSITSYRDIYFEDFQYLNECTYLLVFIPDEIQIYLETTLVATVTGTGIPASELPFIDSTILENRFRVCGGTIQPKDLTRTANASNTITGVTTSTISLTNALTTNLVLPVRFTNVGGTLPTTSPQIRTNRTYFLYTVTTTTARIYSTAEDAIANVNAYTISSAGTGTNAASVLNTWSFANITFKNKPVYDFTGGYNAITFTPGATTGYNITLTASAAIFTTGHVGGAYVGNGGIGRIISFTSTTVVRIDILVPFDSTAAIPGTESLLAEPAWSNARGWPLKCSSFQSRAVFANTELLPNGIWLSAINDFNDFNELQTDDDDAIAWYPTSDNVNSIRFIVPYRSLTIHTNTGIYSTPLSFETALTPKNFSMSLQDSTPATAIQPRGIDNQIVVISGNDVHSLLWDGFNNAYTSNIASVASEHLIDNPHDESEYTDLDRAGSRYMFIINEDGSLVVFQTLIAENVSGFTPQWLEQPYGNAYFRWATASSDGRAWFITEREIAEAISAAALTAYTPTPPETGTEIFPAPSHGMTIGEITAVEFATSGTLLTSTPQIEIDTYYWAVAIDADTFNVYLTQEDAENEENAIEVNLIPANNTVTPWPLTTKFYIEELSFDSYVDCAKIYSGSAVTSVGSLARFNAQTVTINGDGYGFTDDVINDTVEFNAHGAPVEVSEAQIGFPINTTIVPMPVAPPGQVGQKGSSVVFPQHIRTATIMYADSIGGEVNGKPIQYKNLIGTVPGDPPTPTTGIFEISLMNGWNDFTSNSLTITHSDPFEFKLTGIYYKIEVA